MASTGTAQSAPTPTPSATEPTPPTATAPPTATTPPAGVVSFVKVTSDHVADVSSLDAWKQSFIRDDMTAADKEQAIWRSVVAFRHQDEPPRELIETTTHPHDPIKLFNVYGYSQCDCTSSAVAALARSVGLDARVRSLDGHVVAELATPASGDWHLFDASYVAWFPRADGTLASVDDITAATSGWLAQHPELAGNRQGLLAYMANGGWRDGPALLAASPFYSDGGLFPAHVQGWADTMIEFPPPSPVNEPGYTLGYRVNVQLRRGERLVRGWSNSGLHINDDLGLSCDALTGVPGQGDFVYSPAYGDLAPGRVGNGTHEYTLPLAGGAYRQGVLTADNLKDGSGSPLVGVADASQPGVLVVRMASSYVDLAGTLHADVRVGDGGSVALSFSRNHGRDWSPITTFTRDGSYDVDLSRWVRRQYDWRLRVELRGAGSGLDGLSIVDTIQHSQRALPALVAGDNVIHVTSGAAEGTITLEANTDSTQTLNRVYTEYHPFVDGLAEGPLHPTAAAGSLTFPVETPGDLARLRFGTFYRARSAGDRWDYLVSFDDGATWRDIAAAPGPTVSAERFVTYDQIPPGTRTALVRFAGTQTGTLNLFDFRIDADYVEPRGGRAPVKVTYEWDEGGQPKSDTHVVGGADATYTIHCARAPLLRRLIVERADP